MKLGKKALVISLVGIALLASVVGAGATGLLKRTEILEQLIQELPEAALEGLETALEASELQELPEPADADPNGPPDWVPVGPPEGVPPGPFDWVPVGPPDWVPDGKPDETPVGPPDWLPEEPPFVPPLSIPDRPPVSPPLPLPFTP
jgi:hypothetical protein